MKTKSETVLTYKNVSLHRSNVDAITITNPQITVKVYKCEPCMAKNFLILDVRTESFEHFEIFRMTFVS